MAEEDYLPVTDVPDRYYERGNMRVSKEVPRKKKVKKKAHSHLSDRSSSSLSLPDELNVPPESLLESIFMIHGEKAWGKTSLMSKVPDCLTFMYERGRRNLKIFQCSPKDWGETEEYVELFINHPKYKFASIDTLDGCYLQCFAWVCKEFGVTVPDNHSSPHVVWDAIAERFGKLLYMIKESGKGLGFVSHTKARPLVQKRKGLARDEKESEEATTIQRLEPTCKPAAFRLVQEIADFVFYGGYRDGYRVLTVRDPHNIHWVACGLEDRFLDPNGNPIESFRVGNNPSLAYQALQDAYDNKLYDVDYTPPEPERRKIKIGGKKKLKKKVRK